VKGICNPAELDTTSEPQTGNGLPGTPVKASMSGPACRATRVEPWNMRLTCIPPLILSGVGFFIFVNSEIIFSAEHQFFCPNSSF